jgi:hypothetical protein
MQQMLRRCLLALLMAFPVLPQGAGAQDAYGTVAGDSGYEDMAVGESRDVPCEYSFGSSFYSPYGVEFESQWFKSEWRSKRSDFPLPSWNWYYAYPTQTLVSGNGKYRWENAEIQVHCWVYRSLYGITIHRDHVASLGRLVELCEDDWERIDIEAYDDGGTVPNSAPLSTCGGDGGGSGGGGGGTVVRCYTVTIEHYWYYPDTGQIEYRYTEEQTYCEQSA